MSVERRSTTIWAARALAAVLVLGACASPTGEPAQDRATIAPTEEVVDSATDVASQRRPTLLAVGDLGDCGPGGDGGAATAALAQNLSGPILLLGDLAYPDGTRANYRDCFWPSWKPLRSRSQALIGNHDDRHRGVFYDKWPDSGTSTKPWYSYRVGTWRVLVIDANCTKVGCSASSKQTRWVRERLAKDKGRCTALAMHQPRFSSDEEHGDNPSGDAIWRTAVAGGVDLVLAGHAHDYERIGPVGAGGRPNASGPVLLVVGTGGGHLRGFAKITAASERRISDTFGLLKLTLLPTSWRAKFLAAPSGDVRDRAAGGCR